MSNNMYNWTLEQLEDYIDNLEPVDYSPKISMDYDDVIIDWEEFYDEIEPLYNDPTLHPMYGVKHTDESRELIRLSKLGVKRTEFARKRISEGKTGLSRIPFTDEHKKRISESNKGVLRSTETRKRMSESRKGMKHSQETLFKLRTPKKKLTCPHCGKVGGSNGMNRYHFDKCKLYGNTRN